MSSSRREHGARDSDSRRHRSRFDREPSPKRTRRDDESVTEKSSSKLNVEAEELQDHDRKHSRRLQDAVPLDAPLAPDGKEEAGVVKKDAEKKTDSNRDGKRHLNNRDEPQQSKSYFQHDERGSARHVGRSHSRKDDSERGWVRDSKDQRSERTTDRTAVHSNLEKVDKSHARGDDHRARGDDNRARAGDNRAWRHDRFYERESEGKPPVKKRPAFTEQKLPLESKSAEKTVSETLKQTQTDYPNPGSDRKEDRGQDSRRMNRPEKPPVWNGNSNRSSGDAYRSNPQRGHFLPRERYAGGDTYRGRENFNRRTGNHPSGARVEKWKHDLYDETNKSPTSKKEEEQIAKVEALLSL
ncbi:uncharacterized protein LOC141667615 [Apium graveolens]|uniref:uncharacterized protein LOC141667615 n=1 Tax=Apium graveolens TaxID=4045 RepID=UPI003D7BF155